MIELTLFVDHQCNLRCSYCYNGAKFTRRMSADTMRKAVDLALSQPTPHLDVAFFGGEPLLELDLLKETSEYVDEAISRLPPPRPTHRILLNTNGTLFDDESLDWLAPPRVATVFVSLDGPRDVHNRYRVDAAGRGSFDRVMKGLEMLRDRGIAFQLLGVVSVDTAPRLAETAKLLLSQRARKATLSINYRDEWTEESCAALRQGLADAGDVWMRMFRNGTPFPFDPFHTKILTHLKGGIPCPSRCLLGGHEFTVVPSGRIYPCAQMVGEDSRHDLLIGHVDTGLERERMAELQALKDRVEQTCAPCAMKDRCQSHCGCRHLALSGTLGEITATLCETETAVIEAADRVAETLFSERCEAFVDYYYKRNWVPSAGARLTQLRLSRDA